MTSIDFHSNIKDRIAYACRLTRKARATASQIVLLASGNDRLTLDQALWTFSELDFLPHVAADHPLAAQTPIVLANPDSTDLPHHQVLINLSSTTPSYFARFERVIELVGCDETEIAAGRERWLYYKDRGYLLTHVTTGKS